jgi:hypothetical protein
MYGSRLVAEIMKLACLEAGIRGRRQTLHFSHPKSSMKFNVF